MSNGKTNRFAAILGMGMAAMLAGCAGTPESEVTVPGEVEDALLMSAAGDGRAADRDLREARFDLNVKDVPAQAFFLSLAQGTPYNMVVQSRVGGEITLKLKNTAVPEVMDAAREAFGYDYLRSGNTYTVLAEVIQSRVFRVDSINLKRKGRSRITVSSGQLTSGANRNQGGAGGAGAGTGGFGGVGGTAGQQVLPSSDIETESDSDFWKDLETVLKVMIPAADGRSIVINPNSGLVVVRALPSELRVVDGYLRALQSNLRRQVILEAKILEVQLSEGFQAGINWAALGTDSQGNTGFGGVVGGQAAINNGFSATAGAPLIISPGNVTTAFGSSAIGGALTLALNISDFNGVIEALETQGDVRVLSSPRVSTVNNQKAIIKVGTDEFFVTGVSSDTTTGNTTTTASNIEFTPFFSGIALDVTPFIDENNQVTLHVHPTVSEVRDQIKTLQRNGVQEQFPLALSNVRESDSIVRANSGQIIVIGGLMQDSQRDEHFGVPWLSRIPLLGLLFSQTRVRNLKSELVILLRPLVIGDDEQWQDEVKASRQRVKDLGEQPSTWDE